MAIDQRQIADIQTLKPVFVADPITAATTPSIGISWNNSDKKYHINLKLPQFVIDGTGTVSGGSSDPPVVDDPPVEDPPSVTVTTVNSSNLTLKSYGPFYEDGTTHSITASDINNFNSSIMELRGETSKKDEGTYEVEIYLKDPTKYKWSDSRLDPDDPVVLEWTIGPERVLADYTPEEIVAKVRSGEASTIWNVGDRIPITFENQFLLDSGYPNSKINAGTYDAVVLGFDHNLANETPSVSHSMSFAIMYYHNSDDAMCFYSKGYESGTGTINTGIEPHKRITVCNSIYNALPTAWKNAIIRTTKIVSEHTTTQSYKISTETSYVFYLSLFETGNLGYVSPQEYQSGKQQIYSYFEHGGLPKNIKSPNSDGYNVILLSRSDHTNRTGTVLLNAGQSDKYVYCGDHNVARDSRQWVKYPFDSIANDDGIIADENPPDGYYENYNHATAGVIPCFTIG